MQQTIAVFILIYSTFTFAQLEISKSIYNQMPFSSQYSEDGALILNVNYKAVQKIKLQVEKKFDLILEDREEAHVTVLTPPEAQGWFTDQKGVNYVYPTSEIQKTYSLYIQNIPFTVECIGRQENDKGNIVFFAVVKSSGIMNLRTKIQEIYENRITALKLPMYFDAYKDYYAHITIGYVGDDVHGVSKGSEMCKDVFTADEIQWVN